MAARRKRHEEHEEHENHERWLITYADMITLLMVLFIVLFAISQVDLAKFNKLKKGLSDNSVSAPVEAGVLNGQQSLLDGSGNLNTALLNQAGAALQAQQAKAAATVVEQQTFTDVRNSIADKLAQAGLQSSVSFRQEARGLVVTIVTDQVLFDPGSDHLTDSGAAIVDQVAGALVGLSNPMSVEGHTDDTPISSGRFASNWELSTARATSVLRELVDGHGIPPSLLSAAGYADTRPIADNGTAEGRAENRRVEIVVHSTVDQGG